jgi:P-type conjugative transfer protein TrbJ
MAGPKNGDKGGEAMRKRRFIRSFVIISILTVSITAASYSFDTVYDPWNWAENFYEAYQAVQQNEKLLQQLKNQVTMINNEYQNLRALQANIGNTPMQTAQEIDATLGKIQGVGYSIQTLDRSYQDLYQQFGKEIQGSSPSDIQAKRLSQIVATANANINAMRVQAQAVEGINDDLIATDRVLMGSRHASGNLDAQQYGNELAAMQIKQQIKTQQLLAVQNRLDSTRLAEQQAKDYAMEQDYKYRMRNWGTKKSTAVPPRDFP